MDKRPRLYIYDYLCKQIDQLIKGYTPADKLVITKSLRSNYKNNNLPHVAVAAKMKERGKYVTAGTRIQYLFTATAGKNDPQYVKAEDPDYYNEHKDTVAIDYLYYLEKQLVNPIDEVLEVKFGTKDVLKNMLRLLKKDRIKTASEYFYPSFEVAE
jgi:DNA polymerase elongation subunit (family B)